MIDVYRTPAKRYPPACPRCLAWYWMAYDAMWDEFVCGACRAVIDPYWYADRNGWPGEAKREARIERLGGAR